jgi:hypothetical protein
MGEENLLIREATNGTLFLIQLFMWLAIVAFIHRRVKKEGRYNRLDDGLTFASMMAIYFFGAYLSRAVPWVSFIAEAIDAKVPHIVQTFSIAGTVIAVIGGMLTMRLLMPYKMRWLWLSAGALSVLIPIGVHWLLRWMYP